MDEEGGNFFSDINPMTNFQFQPSSFNPTGKVPRRAGPLCIEKKRKGEKEEFFGGAERCVLGPQNAFLRRQASRLKSDPPPRRVVICPNKQPRYSPVRCRTLDGLKLEIQATVSLRVPTAFERAASVKIKWKIKCS